MAEKQQRESVTRDPQPPALPHQRDWEARSVTPSKRGGETMMGDERCWKETELARGRFLSQGV